jgi:PAS domain S-box-containing protein
MSERVSTTQTIDLFDAAATAVVAVDGGGTIRYVNPRATEVFGFSADEMVGQPLELLVPEPRAEAHAALRDAYLQAPIALPHDERRDLKGRRKDGTVFAAQIALTPFDTAWGQWIAASVLDISERKEAEARVRRQSRSYLALALLNEAVARAETPAQLFRRACHIAVVQGGFVGAWVVTREADASLRIQASAGPLAAQLAVASADSQSIDAYISEQASRIEQSGAEPPAVVQALVDGVHSFSDDLAVDRPGHVDEGATAFVRASAALPLISGGRPVACLSLYSDRAGVFDDNLRALLLGAAENISLALDRFQTMADLDLALAQRTDLLHRLVDAEERERSRIAADVHDEPVQSLAAVDLRLGLLERRLQDAAPDLVADVRRVQETIGTVSHGLRDLLFELEPVAPSASLTDLLEEAADHIFELSSTHWTIENEPDLDELELSITTRTQAVRIAKEAMLNAARHARATSVAVRVVVDRAGVTVRVADDGVGLPDGVRQSPPGHRGISGMLDRAAVAGGSVSIESGAGGTSVSVWLPRT